MYVNPERKEEEKFIWKLFLSVMLLLGYNFKSNIKKKKIYDIDHIKAK